MDQSCPYRALTCSVTTQGHVVISSYLYVHIWLTTGIHVGDTIISILSFQINMITTPYSPSIHLIFRDCKPRGALIWAGAPIRCGEMRTGALLRVSPLLPTAVDAVLRFILQLSMSCADLCFVSERRLLKGKGWIMAYAALCWWLLCRVAVDVLAWLFYYLIYWYILRCTSGEIFGEM
jgi:hypothetical protein